MLSQAQVALIAGLLVAMAMDSKPSPAREHDGDHGAEGQQHRPAAAHRPSRWSERTIGRSVVASGTGLHSGVKTGLILQPLPPGSGILFASLWSEVVIPAHLDWTAQRALRSW